MAALDTRPTVHVVEFDPALCEMLEARISHLRFKRIPVLQYLTPRTVKLEEASEIEILVVLSWHLSSLLEKGVAFPNLKWVHCVTAGVDTIVDYFNNSKTTPHYPITRSSISTDAVSEYVIGQILAHRRMFYIYHDNQKTCTWIRSNFLTRSVGSSMTLNNFAVVLLGVGRIGSQVAALCDTLKMAVWGVTKNPVTKGHGCPHVHHYSTTEDLIDVLPHADYVVNTLPSTPLTRGLLDHDVLQHCAGKKPVLINVGRGDVISEASLLRALRAGWISGAVLDVFPVEPLPPDSPLWREPGVTVTPHIAMDMSPDTREKAIAVFLDNYNRFLTGQPMVDLVDLQRGY